MEKRVEPARPYIGGQAVLEGVMMRSPKSFAIVVRRMDGSLVVRERSAVDTREGVWKLPLLRGMHSLVESLRMGNEALRFSSDQLVADLEASDPEDTGAKKKVTVPKGMNLLSTLGYALFLLTTKSDDDALEEPRGAAKAKRAEASAAPPDAERRRSMAPMLLIMVAFMVALPQLAASGIARLLHLDLALQSPGFQALTGAAKLSIVLGYLLLVRRIPDIRRVFQYHGAEHKTITTYEANEPLDLEHARPKTTLHARCGTTFLVMVVLVSILMFTVLGAVLPKIDTGNAALDFVLFLTIKLPFLPVLAGFTFELQRIFAKYFTKGPLRLVLVPGFLVQKITTIQPDDDQLEVALASLRTTLLREDAGEAAPETATEVRLPDYAAVMARGTLEDRAEAA
ncbi:DUF1385 domain-containing protein [soil metagenome]